MPDPVVKKLRDAVDGLVFVSEKDALFEAFEWDTQDALTPARVRELGGHAKRTPVSERTFPSFFEGRAEEQDWHEEAEKEQVRKYRNLLAVFEQNLVDPNVFRVGDINVTYYIVGRSKAGNWVGVKTEAVET